MWNKFKALLASIVLVVAFFLLYMPFMLDHIRLMYDFERADAVVEKVSPNYNSRGRLVDYRFSLAFAAKDGKTVRTYVSARSADRYAVGQAVAVRYIPGTPEKNDIDSPMWICGYMLLATGAIVLGGIGAISELRK